jgi:hypothetical protein
VWILLVQGGAWRRLSGNFSHVLAIDAKNIFGKPRFPVRHPGSWATGAAQELAVVLGPGSTLVRASASGSQLALSSV